MDIAWPFLLLCGVVGVLLGLVYFGSLWWMVRRLPDMSRPGLWFPLSWLLRILVVLIAVYFLTAHHWERLVAMMLGFLLGRMFVFRQLGISRQRSEHI